MERFKHHFHYFSTHVNGEVKAIYWHEALRSTALSMIILFVPIYLYTIGYSLMQIFLFYLLIYVYYLPILHIGVGFSSKFGYKHAIFVSYLFLMAYLLFVYKIESFPFLFYLAPLALAIYKSLFWVSYNTEIAINADGEQRGREVGLLFSLQQVVFIIGPIAAGLITEFFGFGVLFGVSVVLVFASTYPLLQSPDIYATHTFEFKSVIKIFKKYKQNFIGYWGYAEDFMAGSIWPLYMFLIIPDFLDIGAIAGISTFIGALVMLYVGKMSDFQNKRDIIFNTSIFYGVTWILRFLGKTIPGIMTFDILTRASRDVNNVAMISLSMERAGEKDSDHAVAYNAFYEYSVIIGKLVMILGGMAVLAATGNIFFVFMLAGIMTMLYGLLK